MKRLLSTLMCLLLLLSAAGCAGPSPAAASDRPAQATEAPAETEEQS